MLVHSSCLKGDKTLKNKNNPNWNNVEICFYVYTCKNIYIFINYIC